MVDAFVWFMAGMITTIILLLAAVAIYVRVRGPFTVGPPEERE